MKMNPNTIRIEKRTYPRNCKFGKPPTLEVLGEAPLPADWRDADCIDIARRFPDANGYRATDETGAVVLIAVNSL